MSSTILHVLVVGFHHKKGAQVEYAFPAFSEGDSPESSELPAPWKHLPSLALPDGAHNYDKDTVYFHLPSLTNDLSTVFGISCYRQIDAKDVLNKASDVTRNTVQKCVCVLSSLPLYGLVEARLEMITYAWFKERDFTRVSLLEETYRQLQASCTPAVLDGTQVFLGLSCRELVQRLRHKVVVLFKLLLLERKVLVYGSPAKTVCSTLLALLSLMPDMVERGLKESAAYSPHRRLVSPTLKNVRLSTLPSGEDEEGYLEVSYTDDVITSAVTMQGDAVSKATVTKTTRNHGNNSSHTDKPKSRGQSNKNNENSAKYDSSNKLSHNVDEVDNINKKEDLHCKADLKCDEADEQSSDTLTSSSQSRTGASSPGSVCDKSEKELSEKNAQIHIASHDSSNSTSGIDKELNGSIDKTCESYIKDAKEVKEGGDSLSGLNKDLSKTEDICTDNTIDNKRQSSNSNRSMGTHHNTADTPKATQDTEKCTDDTEIHVSTGTGIHAGIHSTIERNTHMQQGLDRKLPSTNQKQGASHDMDHVVTPTISMDTLASEGTASDFGASSHPEELLFDEHTDDLMWQDDRLMLQIDGIGSGQMAEHFGDRMSFEPEETREMREFERQQDQSGRSHGGARMSRMDSNASRTSQGSLVSLASDLGEMGVKVVSSLRSQLTSLWDGADAEDEEGVASDDDVTNDVTDGPQNEAEQAELPRVHQYHAEEREASTDTEASVDGSHNAQKSRGSSRNSRSAQSSAHSSSATRLPPTSIDMDECGFPLPIFTNSLLCHPYLSLQYYELLSDVNVRGFLIGASNMLFKQKTGLIDVIIQVPSLTFTVHDEALRRQLQLSTADLRFADYIVRSVCGEGGDSPNQPQEGPYPQIEQTEWEGGDEWLRSQFRLYLASLLVTVKSNDVKLKEDFGSAFVQALRTTQCYKQWSGTERRGLSHAPPGHPFQGQLSVQDLRVRLAQYERGKKLMDTAGQTGKAIGGALTSAKTAVSSTVGGWFSNIKRWGAPD